MPLWAKVDVDMPADPKLFGQPVATRWLWLCLITLAKQQNDDGAVRGYDCALLAGRFNMPRKGVADALTHYQSARMVELDPDGTIRLLNFVKRQGPEDTSAERTRRYYDSHREEILEKKRSSREHPNGVLTVSSRKDSSLEVEQNRTEKDLTTLSAKPTDASLVFDEWRRVHRKPKAKLTLDRERLINLRLKEGYSTERLVAAVRGCALDEFSMGKNDRNQQYNELKLICRDGPHVEKFEALAPSQKPLVAAPQRKTDEQIMAEVNAEFEAKNGRVEQGS